MLDSCLIDVYFFAQADEIQSVDVFFKRRDRHVARSPLLAARKVLVPSKLAKVQESLRASFALRKPLKASSRWLGHACINCKQAAWFLLLIQEPGSGTVLLLSCCVALKRFGQKRNWHPSRLRGTACALELCRQSWPRLSQAFRHGTVQQVPPLPVQSFHWPLRCALRAATEILVSLALLGPWQLRSDFPGSQLPKIETDPVPAAACQSSVCRARRLWVQVFPASPAAWSSLTGG